MSRLVANKAFVYAAEEGRPAHDVVDASGIHHKAAHSTRLAHGSANDNACGIAVAIVQSGGKKKREAAIQNAVAYLAELDLPYEVRLPLSLEELTATQQPREDDEPADESQAATPGEEVGADAIN